MWRWRTTLVVSINLYQINPWKHCRFVKPLFAISEIQIFPLFFIRALLDTILSQLTPVGHTPIIWFGAFAKHQRKSTVIFTSERLNVFQHASRLFQPEHLLLHIFLNLQIWHSHSDFGQSIKK